MPESADKSESAFQELVRVFEECGWPRVASHDEGRQGACDFAPLPGSDHVVRPCGRVHAGVVDGRYAPVAGAGQDSDRPGCGVPGPVAFRLLCRLRRASLAGGIRPGALPAAGPVPGHDFGSDGRCPPRHRSGGGNAMVVVCLRGATNGGVGSVDVLPRPHHSFDNSYQLSSRVGATGRH